MLDSDTLLRKVIVVNTLLRKVIRQLGGLLREL